MVRTHLMISSTREATKNKNQATFFEKPSGDYVNNSSVHFSSLVPFYKRYKVTNQRMKLKQEINNAISIRLALHLICCNAFEQQSVNNF